MQQLSSNGIAEVGARDSHGAKCSGFLADRLFPAGTCSRGSRPFLLLWLCLVVSDGRTHEILKRTLIDPVALQKIDRASLITFASASSSKPNAWKT